RKEFEDEVITVCQKRQTVILDQEREDYDIEALMAREIDDNN
ncbi:5859_t:CDS:1, partial [Rhizophagus irregularis]